MADLSKIKLNGNTYNFKDAEARETLGNAMIKGVDYVTAGQKSGTTFGTKATAEGNWTIASGNYSHTEGNSPQQTVTITGNANTTTYTMNYSNVYINKDSTIANNIIKNFSIIYNDLDIPLRSCTVDAQGYLTSITTTTSLSNSALSNASVKIQRVTQATGSASHAEGTGTAAIGFSSHSEGCFTISNNNSSHSEGYSTTAIGYASHAEGRETTASNSQSHAEGYNTVASGSNSHAEGYSTTAQRRSQHVFGEYNVLDTAGTTTSKGTYIEIVGNGTLTARSNARTLDWAGNETLAGKLTLGSAPTANMDAATKQYVDTAVSGITIPTVPTNVSDFTNDANYQNATQVNSAITTAIGNINSFDVAVVESTTSVTTPNNHTIYFVPQAVNSSTHDEYMYINDNWELIGTTTVDLSGYLQKTEIADWAKAANKPSYTASEVGAMSTSHVANAITSANITAWNNKSDFSGSYDDLTNKPTIPTVPTNVSDFTNDAGYLTSYTETDPIYSASAAASITTGDISNWNAKSDFSGSYNDLTNKPTIPTIPNNVSAFTNDAGYLTSYTETDPTVPAWAKATTKPTYTAAEVGAIATTHAAAAITATDISNWNAKSNFSGSYNDLTNKPTIPAATTVTNTLSSGILIATINGTNIYAPSYTNGDNLAYGGE